MARFLPLVRFRCTRVLYALPLQARSFGLMSKPARADTIDLSLDDIPTNTRVSSVVDPQTDPKPRPVPPTADDDRAFAMEFWKLDEEKMEDGEESDQQITADMFEPSSSSASSPSASSASTSPFPTSVLRTDTKKTEPFRDVEKDYKDRMKKEMEKEREQTHEQFAYWRADREERRERKLAKLQAREDKAERKKRELEKGGNTQQTLGEEDEQEEEEEDEEESESDEEEEMEEMRNLEDAATGRADLKPDWFQPLNATPRPNTELCTSIDQFVGFFKEIVMSLQDTFTGGFEDDDIEEIKAKFEETKEYLENLHEGLNALETTMQQEDEEHKNYYVASLGGKTEEGVELRDILTKCIDDIEKSEFGYAAQVRILKRLQKFLPASPDEEKLSLEDSDVD